jgi:hypothetical protein
MLGPDRPPTVILILILASLSFASGIPKHAKLEVRLDQGLSSDNSSTGEKFSATLDRPVTLGDKTVLRKGAKVQGVVRYAESTFGYSRAGELDLEVISVTSDGQTYEITTNPLTIAGRQGTQDPGARRTDVMQAAGGVIGPAPRGMSQTIPGTNVAVGGGDSGMQVILPPKTKLSFMVVSEPSPSKP